MIKKKDIFKIIIIRFDEKCIVELNEKVIKEIISMSITEVFSTLKFF